MSEPSECRGRQVRARVGPVGPARSQEGAPARIETSRGAEGRKVPPVVAIALCFASTLLVLAHPELSAAQATAGSTETPLVSTSRAQPPTTTSSPTPTSDNSLEPTQAPQNATAHQSKLKPVNFTLVDELFESVLSEAEVLRRWKNMDGQFQEGIRSILKLVFPQIVAISQDAKVSGDCSGGILKWILSLRNLRSWAIKMLDATGKPTAGIFEGSLTMFGNHRQCLSIRAPDEDEIEITEQFEEYFRGQFCVLHLRPWLPAKKPFFHLNSTIEPLLRKNYKYYEKTLYDELAEIAIAFNFIDIRMDLCVPSTCTTADIQRVADLLSKKLEMKAKVMRCDIESREASSTFVQNLDKTTAYWLIGPLGFILINLISTILVSLGLLNSHKQFASSHHEPEGEQSSGRPTLGSLLFCLSIQGAFKSLLAHPQAKNFHVEMQSNRSSRSSIMNNNNNHNNQDRKNNNNEGEVHEARRSQIVASQSQLDREEILKKPLPLYGLRSVFIVWFVVVQLTVELKYQYLRESLVLRNMMLAYWPFQIIINTSMIFESLVLLTAFTYSYCNLRSTARGLLGYILSKYIRLVPSIMTLILVTIILPSIGLNSPVWTNFVEQQSKVCKSTGYLDLFFLQNFISYDKICLPHTWLFCVELQLIALSIPLIILLKRTLIHNEDSVTIAEGSEDQSPKKRQDGGPAGFQTTLLHLIRHKVGALGLVMIALGVVVNFVLVYRNELPPSWFNTFPDADQKSYYFGIYLTKTWTHLTTFIVGLYAGYLARSTVQLMFNQGNARNELGHPDKTRGLERRQAIRQVSWKIVAFSCLLSIVFCTFTWSTQELPTPIVSALFDSLSRLVWALALASLMVQLCIPRVADQRASFSGLSSLFCHPVCLVLGRLSFLAYLLAPLVHTFVLALQEQALFPSLYLIFHVILGNIVITYLLAFVISLMIEQPIRLISKQLCCINTRTRGSATISTADVTTATSASSLSN